MKDTEDPPEPLYSLTPVIFILGFLSLGLISSLGGLIALLIGSALVSGSEVAYFSLTAEDIQKLDEEYKDKTNRVRALRDRPRSLLATILIANNIINIAIVVLSESIIWRFFSNDLFSSWGESLYQLFGGLLTPELWSRGINLTITVIGITFLLVLFGETAPKIYARRNKMKFAKFMSVPLSILNKLLWPLSKMLVNLSNAMESKLVDKGNSRTTSKEDLDKAIELTVSSEEDSKEEADILKGIVKFSEVPVKQIMRNRVDVIAVDFDTTYNELLDLVKDSGYSRIPVTNEDFDNVTGILYVKDLLPYLDEGDNFEWQNLIRTDVLYAPESKKINEMMKEFQDRRLHMAVVVDEYGGSSGIITLEDILEEVIGEIRDESDEGEAVEYIKIDEKNFIFEGKTQVNDFCRILDLDTSDFDEYRGESDTMAGMLLERSGTMPKPDQEFQFGDRFKFRVIAVNKRRIEQVQITLL